jgi:hypothetical protein
MNPEPKGQVQCLGRLDVECPLKLSSIGGQMWQFLSLILHRCLSEARRTVPALPDAGQHASRRMTIEFHRGIMDMKAILALCICFTGG